MDRLRAEASGILAWVIRGAIKVQTDGLRFPDRVKVATSEYREQEDVFMRFIKEACEIGSARKIGSSDLYKRYTDWCDLMGLTAEPQAWLTGKIREAGYRVGTSGGKATFWGITVKSSMSE